jgi:hypothetical protein
MQGFKWDESGCSLCPALGPDIVGREKRYASKSNRNFENRHRGSIPHLMMPAMVVADACGFLGHAICFKSLIARATSSESDRADFFNDVRFLRNDGDYLPSKRADDYLNELGWLYERRYVKDAAWIERWQVATPNLRRLSSM